jgi:hypothetical protein
VAEFSLLCQNFWDRVALAKGVIGTNGHRNGVRDARKGEESRASRIPSSTPNFENHVTVAVNSALGDLANNTLGLGFLSMFIILLDPVNQSGFGWIGGVKKGCYGMLFLPFIILLSISRLRCPNTSLGIMKRWFGQ